MIDRKSFQAPADPERAFAAVIALRKEADKLERHAVVKAMKAGWSWTQIAHALGISKQAAHKRLAVYVNGVVKE